MMPSNALSKRRGPLRRPKVCFTYPGVIHCPPPPPPPIWPPALFSLFFQYTYPWMGGPLTENWSMDMPILTPPFQWWNSELLPDNQEANFTITDVTETLHLVVEGASVNFGAYHAEVFALPLIWGTTTLYTVTAWDVLTPGLNSAKSIFVF